MPSHLRWSGKFFVSGEKREIITVAFSSIKWNRARDQLNYLSRV